MSKDTRQPDRGQILIKELSQSANSSQNTTALRQNLALTEHINRTPLSQL